MTSTTHTLDVPGATLTYDVHGTLEGAADGGPRPLMMFGSPMDATGFVSLVGHFSDRPVITYDPRGTGRSTRHDGTGPLAPADHAADLRALVDAFGVGPVDVFATSGGAVNALAWVGSGGGGEQVRRLVAHEPPVASLLPDRAALTAAIEDTASTYERSGMGAGMAKFIMLVGLPGPLPDDFTMPDADPAQFGLPTEDDGSRGDPLLGQNLRAGISWEPDIEGLLHSGTEIVLARGKGSGEEMAARGASAVAQALGSEAVSFPSHHAGFMGGEYGMAGEPDAFAAALREALDT